MAAKESQEAVKKASELRDQYTQACRAKKSAEAARLLAQLKVVFTKFPTFLNPCATSPLRVQEVMLVRDTFEHACLNAAARVAQEPEAAITDFGRHFEVLRQYYTDFAEVQPSERRLQVLGLNLLRLLANHETVAFHMELESVSVGDLDSVHVKDVVQLERYLQEGSYNKLLDARKKVPSADYAPLMDMLVDTVRRAVFDAAPRAYDSLSFEGALKLLMYQSEGDMTAYIRAETDRRRAAAEAAGEAYEAKWRQEGQRYQFVSKEADKTQRKDTLPFDSIMRQQLDYAHEMQRVV
eukprot:TRINITY_DN1678_c0_g4_i1.p1 TRINITY_DN1678_c0_g4~~TRINITY_DN1678_c0_g4_i1.p1  ORF type:complete len:321 (+),score=162.24 TRINITY_DN1678_c0_g4_i1:80-964(+)